MSAEKAKELPQFTQNRIAYYYAYHTGKSGHQRVRRLHNTLSREKLCEKSC